ncbi:restriction endonuclease subunit S [Tamlana fucoidanivorans]|uniref:Restriction endonuclease subunit S n=1 Tax=Allotamlana fucoidanivorans TaxID=2583814 RepID=A0A5C4SCR8_9FLAO|nr:restriction endonuclease subunit S [Tamlana fucoidanivorans]TNJ41354.1 restriction endonuclease subunit S [Tamlana fucoidanivorans]
MEAQNTPQLRFPEFEGEWEVKKINDITSKVGSGKTPKGGVEVYQDNGIPFIRSQNVIGNSLILDKTHISQEIHNSMKGSKVLPNDILLNITGGSIGRSCVVPSDFSEGNVNQHVCIIRLKSNNSYLIQLLLSSHNGSKQIFQGMAGGGREGINFQAIRNFKFIIPKTLPEQQKIANFLSSVDKKIDLLTQKKQALDQYKKGVMQKIFSQQIRFKDDNGNPFPNWETKKLGEVCQIKKGEQLNKELLSDNEEYPAINGGINPSGYTSKYNCNENTITISEGGNSCGYINYITQKFWLGGHCYSLKELSGYIYDLFLFQYLKVNELKVMSLRVGSGLPNIQKKDIYSFKIDIPCLEEQQKIANFLSAIDKKIESVNTQLQNTQTFKKGLLQQMFV